MSGEFLTKRGRCCKSTCLHCPYGFTLKKFGLQFKDAQTDMPTLNRLTGRDIPVEEAGNYKLIFLKEELAGAIRVNHIQVKELFLHEDFRDQNLSLEIVESYYFY